MSNLLHLANQIARRPWGHAEPLRMLQEMDHLLRDPFFSPVTRDYPLRTRRFARPQRPVQQQQQQPQQAQQQQQSASQTDKAVQQSQSQSNAVAENETARNQSQPVSRWSNRWMADPFFTDSVFAPSRFERDLWGRFDPFFNQMAMERTALPETDVSETDKAFVVTMDVPGVRKEDVKIRLGGRDNRTLTITAERREETEEAIESAETVQPSAAAQASAGEQATTAATTTEPTSAGAQSENKATETATNAVQVQAADSSNNKVARPTRRSVSSFKFSQTLELPENADVRGITAKCEHGQLRLTIPKMEMAPEEEQTIPIQ